jgi:polar amino acid transport system substrate-binding protein
MPLFMRRLAPFLLFICALQGRADPVATYQIVSGNLPPFTAEQGPDAPGALGTLVHEMALRLGEAPPIQFYPWTRALTLATSQPRTLILPLTRTPEREANYRWMVKLYRQQFVFIALRTSAMDLDTLDTMKDLRIAALRGSPNVLQLTNRQFKRVSEANSVQDMARMLDRGMVDALYGGEAINLLVLGDYGLARNALKVSKPLDYGDIWLAGSLDFTDADAAQWQNAMKQLVREGVVRKTLGRYGLPQ